MEILGHFHFWRRGGGWLGVFPLRLCGKGGGDVYVFIGRVSFCHWQKAIIHKWIDSTMADETAFFPLTVSEHCLEKMWKPNFNAVTHTKRDLLSVANKNSIIFRFRFIASFFFKISNYPSHYTKKCKNVRRCFSLFVIINWNTYYIITVLQHVIDL